MPSGRRRGLTLIELVVVVAIAGILLAVAVPSFRGTIARMRLEGALNELSIDLQYARSQAIRLRNDVALATAADGASYTIAVGATTLKTVQLPTGVTVTGNVTITFDALRGTANAGTIDASATGTASTLRVSSGALGRVQLCTPGSTFPGYQAC